MLLCETNHVLESDYSEVIVVGAGTDAIHQSGKWYTNEKINQMLMERHLIKMARRGSHKNHIKRQGKRTEDADVQFAQSFEKLILMVTWSTGIGGQEYGKENYAGSIVSRSEIYRSNGSRQTGDYRPD